MTVSLADGSNMIGKLLVAVSTLVIVAAIGAVAVLHMAEGQNVADRAADQEEPAAQGAALDKPAGQRPVELRQHAGPQPTAPVAAVRREFGDWVLQCPGEATAGGCSLFQQHITIGSNQLVLGITMRPRPEGDFQANLRTSLGVALRPGIELMLDGETAGRIAFAMCRPRVCDAVGTFRGELIDRLASGAKLVASFQMYSGQTFALEISEQGLSDALLALQAETENRKADRWQ